MGKFCPTQNLSKKKDGEKKNFVFLPALPKKRKQARSAGNGRQPKAG